MPYPSYPFTPLLADEEDALGLSLGGDDTADDPNTDPNTDPTTGANRYQATTPAVAPDLTVKFSAPKLGELPGFVGEDRVLLQKPEIPETQITPMARQSGMGIGTGTGPGMLQPPTIDQSNLQAYTQHMGTSPFGKKPGFWNKLAAGLYGGASVLAATQAQPHVSRVNPMQIANGVQGILRPGQGRMMQEWDLKRRGLEDAARLEAMNNATRMRQYGIESQDPVNQSRIELNRKHGQLYDAIGQSKMLSALNPKPTTERPATNREALVARDLQDRLNSADPKIRTAAQQELEAFKKQQSQRVIPAAQRSAIQALKQQYLDQEIDDETATIYATQDWMAEQQNIQAQKTKESESRVEGNQARSKRDISIANRNDRTPVGGVARPGEARAATSDAVTDVVARARNAADNNPAKAIDYINSQTQIDPRVKERALAVFRKERDVKKTGPDFNSIRNRIASMKSGSGGSGGSGAALSPASPTIPTPATPATQSTGNKPATSNNYTRRVWDAKTGTTKPK